MSVADQNLGTVSALSPLNTSDAFLLPSNETWSVKQLTAKFEQINELTQTSPGSNQSNGRAGVTRSPAQRNTCEDKGDLPKKSCEEKVIKPSEEKGVPPTRKPSEGKGHPHHPHEGEGDTPGFTIYTVETTDPTSGQTTVTRSSAPAPGTQTLLQNVTSATLQEVNSSITAPIPGPQFFFVVAGKFQIDASDGSQCFAQPNSLIYLNDYESYSQGHTITPLCLLNWVLIGSLPPTNTPSTTVQITLSLSPFASTSSSSSAKSPL